MEAEFPSRIGRNQAIRECERLAALYSGIVAERESIRTTLRLAYAAVFCVVCHDVAALAPVREILEEDEQLRRTLVDIRSAMVELLTMHPVADVLEYARSVLNALEFRSALDASWQLDRD